VFGVWRFFILLFCLILFLFVSLLGSVWFGSVRMGGGDGMGLAGKFCLNGKALLVPGFRRVRSGGGLLIPVSYHTHSTVTQVLIRYTIHTTYNTTLG